MATAKKPLPVGAVDEGEINNGGLFLDLHWLIFKNTSPTYFVSVYGLSKFMNFILIDLYKNITSSVFIMHLTPSSKSHMVFQRG